MQFAIFWCGMHVRDTWTVGFRVMWSPDTGLQFGYYGVSNRIQYASTHKPGDSPAQGEPSTWIKRKVV